MKKHPIQLCNLVLEELSIVSLNRYGFEGVDFPHDFNYTVSISELDLETKRLFIKVDLAIEPKDGDQPDRPFKLKVVAVGEFNVDVDAFPVEHLSDWAFNNGALILYPYVREQAYGLTVRAGYKPILLPLFEIPTFKIQRA